MQQYLIAIGGTGAKCAEALAYLAMCNVLTEDVHIVLVDQDKSNGNLARTKDLLHRYGATRSALYEGDGAEIMKTVPFLRRPIPYSEHLDLVRVDRTFEHLLKGDTGSGPLLPALFKKAELDLSLERGFRGRPAIGTIALQAENAIGRLLESVTAEEGPKRILLVGSVFGGMGASGLPMIARELAAINEGDIEVGAVFLLPYFTFKPVNDEVAAHPNTFLEQTRSVLTYYYERLLEQPGLFSHLYLTGWDPLLMLPGSSQLGGVSQCNPPLMPELYAALAAKRFFNGEAATGGPLFRTDLSSAGFTWDDVPDANAVRASLGQLIRFAYAFCGVYAKHLEAPYAVRRQEWVRRLGDPARLASSPHLVATVKNLCTSILRWFSSLTYYSDVSRKDFLRADLIAPLSDSLMAENDGLIPLHQSVLGGQLTVQQKQEFVNLVGNGSERTPARFAGLPSVFDYLTDTATAQRAWIRGGVPSCCAALYSACQAEQS